MKKSFKELKNTIVENRYLVKFEKGGSMKLREYEASSAMAAESKAKVDAKRMGFTVASVRLKETEKKTKDSPAMDESVQVDEAHQEVSADYKVTASGRKVPVQRKQFKDMEDEEEEEKEVKEDVNKSDVPAYLRKKTGDKLTTQDLEKERTKNRSHPEMIKKINGTQVKEDTEIVEGTVKTGKYSWGTMKTVHHGADFSIPLHPEHHQAIHALKHDQEHKFKDETGRNWTAKRDNDKVKFQSADLKTTVNHSDLKEATQEVHRVSVTVTDPHHPATTMRATKIEKRVKVKANDREHAIDSALHFYKKQGLKVHDHNYIGVVKEEVKQIDELSKKTLGSYIKKASGDAADHHGEAQRIKGWEHDSMYDDDETDHYANKANKRMQGVHKAVNRLTKETVETVSVEQLEESKWEKTGAHGLAKDFGDEGHVSTTKKDITVHAKVHNSSHSDGAPVLKNFDRKEKYSVKTVTIPKGSKVVHNKANGYSYTHHPEHGHIEFEHDDIQKKEGVELDLDSLFEAVNKEETRLIQLARLGLVDKSDVSKLRMAMEQLKSDKPLSVAQRSLLLNVLEELFGLVTGDDQVFMRLKKDVQNEGVEKKEEEPPFDPDPPKKNPSATAGKYGSGYSTARHLARLALQKQQKKKGK